MYQTMDQFRNNLKQAFPVQPTANYNLNKAIECQSCSHDKLLYLQLLEL